MLTRDIELTDAILDLLDNCLDGVLRVKKQLPPEGDFTFYNGFCANIDISENEFCITDNCGGIPYDVALKYAFRMGKPDDYIEPAEALPTVGVYGIGMKRAIFKMGMDATVCSKTNEKSFCVHIPEDWANTGDSNWGFPIKECETGLGQCGTKVEIRKLVPEVSSLWREDRLDTFLNELKKTIAYHYSFIIEKGFKIKVNRETVTPNSVRLLLSEQIGEKRLTPYIYQTTIDDVDVRLALGFYNSMITEEEMDEENEGRKSSKEAVGQ
jgi:hypothetical protein